MSGQQTLQRSSWLEYGFIVVLAEGRRKTLGTVAYYIQKVRFRDSVIPTPDPISTQSYHNMLPRRSQVHLNLQQKISTFICLPLSYCFPGFIVPAQLLGSGLHPQEFLYLAQPKQSQGTDLQKECGLILCCHTVLGISNINVQRHSMNAESPQIFLKVQNEQDHLAEDKIFHQHQKHYTTWLLGLVKPF